MKTRLLCFTAALTSLVVPTVATPAQELLLSRDIRQAAANGSLADEWLRPQDVRMGEQLKQVSVSNLELVEATKAWKEAGVQGEGMLISIIDTGIHTGHPDMPEPRDKRLARQKTGSTHKVINGFNWADRNTVTKDVSDSQHGMHVAGIAAANGKIKGVAPEAQLLNQKVFSNYQGELPSLSESILFAMNDSITKKADVINLSLGSSAGYVDEVASEQFVIKKAVDQGIIVVAAAGNDGYFGSERVSERNPDYEMVSSPGIAPDALSVASANSTMMAGLSFQVDGMSSLDRVVYMVGYPSSGEAIKPNVALSRSTELVYVGRGKKEDYHIPVKGKVVLIERGDLPFDEKLRLAKAAGAAGAIIYNNQPGPLLISANEAKNIPAVSILRETGEQLAQALKKGKTIKVRFDGQYGQNALPYPNGGIVSSFSSWGPTPDLQFKPEITAPGGGILSTIRESDYAVKSGTSMATPHVAGGMALLKQAYLKQGRKLEGRQLVETLKAAVMNTAEPILDPREVTGLKGSEKKPGILPYSPRVQGAGMMKIAKAIQTPVIITDKKGKAGVSLGEIGHTTQFSLFVENRFGKQPVTYDIQDAFGVMTDLHHDGINLMTESPLSGAKLQFSADKVTVAPGKKQEIKVKLTLPPNTKRNIFADGYIRFVPQQSELPTLHVPYYGFFGEWDEPRVMDAPMWDNHSQEKRTGVKSTWYFDKENHKWKFRDYLGVAGVAESGKVLVNPARIAFSPNGDGHYDVAAPSVTFLRNAKQVTIDVVDAGGKTVRSLVKDEKVNKYDQSRLGVAYYYTEKQEWGWDGQIYSPQKGEYVPAPDGQYQFVIRARIDEKNANWQTLKLPITVDREPPRVTASLSGNRINWSSKDRDIQGYFLYIDGKKAGGPYSATETGTFVNQPNGKITLVAYDYAGNLATIHLNGKGDMLPPRIVFPNELFQQLIVTNENTVSLRGKVSGEELLDRVRLSIYKMPVPLEEDGSFQKVLTLPEGLHYVEYSAIDFHGNQRQFTQRIIVDKTPPALTLINNGAEEVFFDPSTKRMLLPIRFTYSDVTYKGQVKVNGRIIANWEEDQLEVPVNKVFVHSLPLSSGDNRILIEGRDAAGNQSQILLHAYADTYTGSVALFRDEQRYKYQAKPMPALSLTVDTKASAEQSSNAQILRGRLSGVAPYHVHLKNGEQQLEADVNDHGEFRIILPATQGRGQPWIMEAGDALGRQIKRELSGPDKTRTPKAN